MLSSLRPFSQILRDAALALLYPRACGVCGGIVESQSDGAACAACWEGARIFSSKDSLCSKCGAHSNTVNLHENEAIKVRCGRCKSECFTAARAVGIYEGALRASILGLKREPFVSERLAELLYQVQQREPLSNATRIMPVPLHRKRERERGYNQAAELARTLSGLTGLLFDAKSLARVRHTERHRALMDERARRESVRDAFEVLRPRLVKGERVLLIDDVYTTGATVSACAAALLQGGAESVYVLTVARSS